ncbi:MAG: SemiSWEET transporter [Candidatus Diapherotrites archaeon]
MELVEIIGFFAATLTTIAFLPQVLQVHKTKSAKDISLKMYILFCIGITLWFVYGVMLSSLPIILANGITFILALVIIFYKLKYG